MRQKAVGVINAGTISYHVLQPAAATTVY